MIDFKKIMNKKAWNNLIIGEEEQVGGGENGGWVKNLGSGGSIDNQSLKLRSTNNKRKTEEIQSESVTQRQTSFSTKKLKFSKLDHHKNEIGFNFLKSKEVIEEYLPSKIKEELGNSSCEEEEEEEEKEYQERKRRLKLQKQKYSKQIEFGFENESPILERGSNPLMTPSNSSFSSSSDNELFEKIMIEEPKNTTTQKEKIDEHWQDSDNDDDKKKKGESSNKYGSCSEDMITNLPESTNLQEIEEARKNSTNVKKKNSNNDCFACDWITTHSFGVKEDAAQNLVTIMHQGIGHIKTRRLAKLIHERFKKTIYFPTKEKLEKRDPTKPIKETERIKIWRTWQIYEHITEHINDPRFILFSQLERALARQNTLERMTFSYYRDPTGTQEFIHFDKDIDKANDLCQERILKILKSEPKKMLYYNESLPTASNVGEAMNPFKDYRFQDSDDSDDSDIDDND